MSDQVNVTEEVIIFNITETIEQFNVAESQDMISVAISEYVAGENVPNVVAIVTSAEPIGGHRLVNTDGNYASAYNLLDINRVVGITTAAYSQGVDMPVVRAGTINEPSWGFQEGAVYLGDNGLLTQDISEALFILQVGMAIKPTCLVVDFQMPIRR